MVAHATSKAGVATLFVSLNHKECNWLLALHTKLARISTAAHGSGYVGIGSCGPDLCTRRDTGTMNVLLILCLVSDNYDILITFLCDVHHTKQVKGGML